ncbi:MAG: hypothetical protein ABSH10_00750 [Phycisphaerae bacterium]
MSRIMINSAIVAAVLFAALAWPGCSKEYARRPLGKDGPEGQEVRGMVAALRSADATGLEAVLRRQMAGGLTELQAQSLEATLIQLAKAEAVELEALDRFGEDVTRAALRVTSGGASRTVCLLLVRADGRLRWAGRN